MKRITVVLLLTFPILAKAQFTVRPIKSSGFKVSLLACGQEITNVPTVRSLGFKGDTVVYNQTGSEIGKISFAVSYFQIQPIAGHLLLQSSIGFRRRGFITDTKFDKASGFALPSAMHTNNFDNLFVDVGLRLHSGVGQKLIWFLIASNRIDYLAYSKTPFWGQTRPYRRIEYSPVFQAGFGFVYGSGGKRCFIELEGNPGVMNVLRGENYLLTHKTVGAYPSIPIQTAQKIATNYSAALSVEFEY